MADMIAKLDLEGFEEVGQLLKTSAFKARLRKYVKQATQEIGTLARREARDHIKRKKYDANSVVTLGLKKGKTPLRETGNLYNAVQKRTVSWNRVYVGVLKSKTVYGNMGEPIDIISLAKILHEGHTQTVTPKMRKFFASMHRLQPQLGFKPIKPGITKIVIPARPFLMPIVSTKMLKLYKDLWSNAVFLALNKKS